MLKLDLVANARSSILTAALLADSVVGVYLFRADNPIYFGSFSRAFVAMFLIIGPPRSFINAHCQPLILRGLTGLSPRRLRSRGADGVGAAVSGRRVHLPGQAG